MEMHPPTAADYAYEEARRKANEELNRIKIELEQAKVRLSGKFEPQVGGIVPEPVIDDYEVKVVFNDGTKTALYFKELDFIKDLGWQNVDRIIITARWK